MSVFYHVARNDISNIGNLDLRLISSFPGSISCIPLYDEKEFKNCLELLYPNGISYHGINYLFNPYKKSTGVDGVDLIPNTPMIETTFEMVRQWKFPTQKSRFESVFACTNIEDAKVLLGGLFCNKGIIYEVECENFFIADMNLLVLGMSIPGNIILAEKYWSGKKSEKPFLEVLMYPPIKILRRCS